MVRIEGSLLRSAATLLFNVSRVEDMSMQFGTRKRNARPCSRETAILDRLGGLDIFTIFLSHAEATRSLSSAG